MTFLSWLGRDGKLLYVTMAVRSVATNFISVFFAIFLTLLGVPLWHVGLVITGGFLVSTSLNFVTGFLADRLGRRRTLIFYSLLSTLSGLVYAFTSYVPVLVAMAIVAAVGSQGPFGPADMLERVILAQSSSDEMRTRVYAVRSTLGSLSGAVGFLFGGASGLFQSWFNVDQLTSFRGMFLMYAVLFFFIFISYSLLSDKAETETFSTEKKTTPLSPRTRSIVTKLSLLFSMDSFGGGLITSTLVSYWFFQRFDLSLDVIGFIFFASRLLAASSFMVAAKIAEWIGLINTMVYSHLPASIALIFIPYMPTLLTSVALYVGRSLLASMDVPCRQSYIMAVVEPEERTRVSGLINLPRNFAQALSPMIAGVLMQFAGLSFPFLIGGAVKSTYDVLLYITFRDIKPSREKNKTKQ